MSATGTRWWLEGRHVLAGSMQSPDLIAYVYADTEARLLTASPQLADALVEQLRRCDDLSCGPDGRCEKCARGYAVLRAAGRPE